jgi:tetratricopeptide (TPR) repeat protein
LLGAAASAAPASVTVIGNSNARLCYEAADSPLVPRVTDVQICDEALMRDALARFETVATHVNRGILKLRLGRTDEAIADFDRAIVVDPDQPEAYLNKGAALIRLNNAREALPLFTVALERRTSRPEIAHYGRGVAYEALGNLAAAYRDYRRASELKPDWEEPRAELARFRVVEQ